MRAKHTDLVDDLNRLMAEEVEASLRYFQIRFRLRGKNRLSAERFFQDALKETMEHADAIANEIRALGHIPRLQVNLALDGTPMNPFDALAEALEVEQQALAAYKDFLPQVMGHPKLEEFIRRQIAVGTEHVQEILQVVQSAAPLKLVTKNAL